MTITIKLFAILRDRAGTGQIMLELAEGATAADAAQAVGGRYPALAPFMARVACAVNQTYAQGQTILHEGDELALIPPVSGGRR